MSTEDTGFALAGSSPRRAATAGLEWIEVAPASPYFVTSSGAPWTPVGHNDAISWAELEGLYRARDLPAVQRRLEFLKEHGVTCIRLMLEYAQVRHRYIERPVGAFVPAMVRLWDDMFALCERVGLRILLTPFDTFWTWLHWRRHPYNRLHGGPLAHPSRLLLCAQARAAIKGRLTFAVKHWGGSGALFAWDLWNEIHPAQAEGSAQGFDEFIHDLSQHVRSLERRLYGRSHPQTVSLFGPELTLNPQMGLEEPILRHPDLDFASLHIYEHGTIDDPRDTVAPALAMGRIVQRAIDQIHDGRPFFDSEHGPIHTFKDRGKTLPQSFDEEYFRHMQWAHVASGGAGGGMRWPNRKPHVLTPGMRKAQRALARFLPLIDWRAFNRTCLNDSIDAPAGVAAHGCGASTQALVWLLRTDALSHDGRCNTAAAPIEPTVGVPGLAPGAYRVTAWDTREGRALWETVTAKAGDDKLRVPVGLTTDLALAIRRA